MKATKNLVHALAIAGWVLMGVWFSLKCLVGGAAHLHALAGVSYWLWLAGLAALTSFGVSRVESALGALGVHALVFFGMGLLPQSLPLSLFRLGLDLLRQA